MYVGKDWHKGLRQAQANANASRVPWIVWSHFSDVHCERATERDMAGESVLMREGGKIVEPTEEPLGKSAYELRTQARRLYGEER